MNIREASRIFMVLRRRDSSAASQNDIRHSLNDDGKTCGAVRTFVGATMEQKGILYMSNADVKKVLDLGRAIEITEQALRDHSEGRVIWSTPEDLAVKPEQGWQSWVSGCALSTESVAGYRNRSMNGACDVREWSPDA